MSSKTVISFTNVCRLPSHEPPASLQRTSYSVVNYLQLAHSGRY